MSISDNYKNIRLNIPEEVTIVVAAKKRTPEEVLEVIAAGATHIGENYVQEAEIMHTVLGDTASNVQWHLIGNLQTNKINKALKVFDSFQTIDSIEKAESLNKRVEASGKLNVDILIEVNIGDEDSKTGTTADVETLVETVKKISQLNHLKLKGLMTMGPVVGDPEESRPYFRETKKLFDHLKKLKISNVTMKTLSMGMSNSYRIAIEEGANMIRLGTSIFGERQY